MMSLGWVGRSIALALTVAIAGSSAALSAQFGITPSLVALGMILSFTLGLSIDAKILSIALVVLSVCSGLTIPFGTVNLRLENLLLPALVVAMIRGGSLTRWRQVASHPVIPLIGAFVLLNALSSAISSPDFASSGAITIWYGLNLLQLILVAAVWFNQPAKLLSLMRIAPTLAVITGIVGWPLLYFLGIRIWAANDPESGTRSFGVALEPNILAGYATLWILILLTQASRPTKADRCLIAGCLIVIPLTSTRASIVALVAAFAILAVTNSRLTKRILPVVGVAVVALLAVVAAAPAQLLQSFSKLSDLAFQNQTSTFRYDVWGQALSDLNAGNITLGLGTNSFGQRHPLSTDPTHQIHGYIGNLPIQALYDVGILGILVILVAAGVTLFSRRSVRTTRRFTILVAFLIIGIACDPMFLFSFWAFLLPLLSRDVHAKPGPDPPTTASTDRSPARGQSRRA